jgi:hypothetical protein
MPLTKRSFRKFLSEWSRPQIARRSKLKNVSKNAVVDIRFNARSKQDAKKNPASGTAPATGHFF